MILFAGAAGLAAWLTLSYDPTADKAGPDDKAGTMSAVMSIDLSKDGSGRQAPPDRTEKSEPGQGDKKSTDAKQDEAKKAEPRHQEKAPEPAKPESKTPPDSDAQAPKPEPAPDQAAAKLTPGPQPAPQASPDQADKVDGQAGVKPSLVPSPAPAPTRPAGGGKFTAGGGLHPAPDPALIKSTKNGPLPVVAPDGRTPLQVYARPYKATGRPRIAVVVGSLGLSRATTMTAIQQLPGGVTLAFAPYGRNLQDYVNQARAAGHEVLLQVPMEPMDYPTNDPGPHTLLTSLTIHRNLQRLDWLLGRFSGYVGVVNFMGGRFTSTESHLRPILEAMRDRGLMFLDARASSSSVASDVAGKIGLNIAANDRVVDAIASRAAIDARLLELERLAAASGGAIGIGFPYPVTIERLAQWTRAMADRGFDLVPVSAVTDHQEAKN
ncbi:MAG: divergent polysaccharide deacetylase family protein [Alphaproteobacteria bacterium]|nr:divergent polysaccharide deacetylase family protein [Alphaproteobacteria bacterium]MDP6873259.1 divergent polysaccharide deacetylase family protein [Alphaproteobacteria bacterium]